MGNPYKDAERRRREAAEQKRKEAEEAAQKLQEATKLEESVTAPAEAEKPVETKQEPQEGQNVEERVTSPTEPEKPVEVKQEPMTADLLAGLNIEKNVSKTFSFYLSVENVKKLEKLAKKSGVSASKLLDHIISKL